MNSFLESVLILTKVSDKELYILKLFVACYCCQHYDDEIDDEIAYFTVR